MHPTPLRHFVKDILSGFGGRNQKKLRKLMDIILKETVIHFTKPTYELGVLSYILSKILSKPRFMKNENSAILKEIEYGLRDLSRNIDNFPEQQVLKMCEHLSNTILELEERDSRYLNSIVLKARLKSAATLYAQGVSLGVASDVTGIDKQDIQNYAGKTRMFDRVVGGMPITERMKLARKMIGS